MSNCVPQSPCAREGFLGNLTKISRLSSRCWISIPNCVPQSPCARARVSLETLQKPPGCRPGAGSACQTACPSRPALAEEESSKQLPIALLLISCCSGKRTRTCMHGQHYSNVKARIICGSNPARQKHSTACPASPHAPGRVPQSDPYGHARCYQSSVRTTWFRRSTSTPQSSSMLASASPMTVERRCPTCISLATLGEEKSTTALA